ncbi:MAG: hypothetical protein HC815_19555 [Richelia sp. RM1_1_1]|nr:hypothetical protein [Richelia sp. RM1_1_1]
MGESFSTNGNKSEAPDGIPSKTKSDSAKTWRTIIPTGIPNQSSQSSSGIVVHNFHRRQSLDIKK